MLVPAPLLWVAETTLVEFILAGYLRRSYSLLLFLLLYTKEVLLRRLFWLLSLVNCSADVALALLCCWTVLMLVVGWPPFVCVNMVWFKVDPCEFWGWWCVVPSLPLDEVGGAWPMRLSCSARPLDGALNTPELCGVVTC